MFTASSRYVHEHRTLVLKCNKCTLIKCHLRQLPMLNLRILSCSSGSVRYASRWNPTNVAWSVFIRRKFLIPLTTLGTISNEMDKFFSEQTKESVRNLSDPVWPSRSWHSPAYEWRRDYVTSPLHPRTKFDSNGTRRHSVRSESCDCKSIGSDYRPKFRTPPVTWYHDYWRGCTPSPCMHRHKQCHDCRLRWREKATIEVIDLKVHGTSRPTARIFSYAC